VLQERRKNPRSQAVNLYAELAAKMRTLAVSARSREGAMEFERLAVLYDRLVPLGSATPFRPTWGGASFHFDRAAIAAIVPNTPGVYALWKSDGWIIYVGEGDDVQRQLLAHLAGDNEGITREAPTGFWLQVIPSHDQRAALLETWIRELTPRCNAVLA
jgi:hypothetical protein